jgi:hypothetical protein
MTRALILAAASLAAVAAPGAASAQSYGSSYYNDGRIPQECQQQLNNQRLTGAVVGGIAGALLGRSVSARQSRTGAGAIGAVVGAIAGSEVARGRLTCDDAYRSQQSYRTDDRRYGYDDRRYDNRGYHDNRRYQPSSNDYYNNGYGNDYGRNQSWQTSYPTQYSAYGREVCGWGKAILKTPDGDAQTNNVWMCRAQNGAWYAAQR